MFKNEYQGGPCFKVFSAQDTEPGSLWKVPSPFKKEFDKDVKSYVYSLEGNISTVKLQLPKDSKTSLGLLQRYLVLQVCIPRSQDFRIDLGICDHGRTKRRVALSTAYKETAVNPLHCKIPLALLRRGEWLNLCLDMHSFVGENWRGQTHKSIDSIIVSANCKLRRIFTMKSQPPDDTGDDDRLAGRKDATTELDQIPKQFQFAHNVAHKTQVLNMHKIWHYEGKDDLMQTVDLDSSSLRRSLQNDDYHIAFGTKISKKRTSEIGKDSSVTGKSAREQDGSSRDGSLTSRGGSGRDRDSGGHTSRGGSGKDRSGSGGKERTGSGQVKESGRGGSGSKRGPATHTRSKPADHTIDSVASHPPRPERPPPGRPNAPRRDSEPCSNEADPDLTVDKDSLRTSHTWTDGADGKEDIPFVKVKPHPPSQPSSAGRARRKPRVKSAGKERTPHGGRPEETSFSSVTTSNNSSTQSSRANSGTTRGAGDSEEDVRRAMQAVVTGSRRRHRGRGEDTSESEAASSHNTSGGGGDSDLADVIEALNSHHRTGPDGDGGAEYEDSDDDEEDESNLYAFSSPPKSVSDQQRDRTRRKPPIKQPSRTRKKESPWPTKRDHPPLEHDFTVTTTMHSSEEELSSRTRTLAAAPGNYHHGNGVTDERRHRKDTTRRHRRGADNRDQDQNHRHDRQQQRQHEDTTSEKENLKDSGVVSNGGGSGMGPLHIEVPPIQHSALTPSPKGVGVGGAGGGSQTRASISRKSLREIPQEEIRKSGGSKPYAPTKYQMVDDLSESFEARMLLSLQREAANDRDSDDDGGSKPEKASLDQYRYGDDADMDSSDDDDDDHSTMKLTARQAEHNYSDEMRTLGNEFLTQSNPRDWGNVFSPPIVLPGTGAGGSGVLTPSDLTIGMGHHPTTNDKFGLYRKAEPATTQHHQQTPASDGEEELDLLYDPILNCYYDPKTCKYYELV